MTSTENLKRESMQINSDEMNSEEGYAGKWQPCIVITQEMSKTPVKKKMLHTSNKTPATYVRFTVTHMLVFIFYLIICYC